MKTHAFSGTLELIGINPFVEVPHEILEAILHDYGRTKGHIPVCGTVNGKTYTQRLVKYSGAWRFYINTQMLPQSPKRIGEILDITIAFDPADRSLPIPGALTSALNQKPQAKQVFDALPVFLQKEIIRYIATLKTDESKTKNIERAISFLEGWATFVGRRLENGKLSGPTQQK